MGNQISLQYEINKSVCATGGPGFCWQVYQGTHKTNGRPVSVLIFDKKNFGGGGDFNKKFRGASIDQLVALLKRDVSTMCRLRHPCLLEVIEPVSESPTSLAFVTEPLIGNLANVLGNYTNFTTGIDRTQEKYELDELEIQKGILQLSKGLDFLHKDCKLVHGNLVPEAIWVNAKGDWKLSGFQFSEWDQYTNSNDSNAKTNFPEHNASSINPFLPNLDFASPEYALNHTLVPESDTFSLGCFIYALYHTGASPIRSQSNILSYKSALDSLPSVLSTNAVASVQRIVPDLVHTNPSTRLQLKSIETHPAFQTPLLAAVKFLDELPTMSDLDKAQFFKRLATTIDQFPTSVIKRKFLPILTGELKLIPLVPFVLPAVLASSSKCTTHREFMHSVVPFIRPLFTVTNPPQVMLAVLQNIASLATQLGPKQFQTEMSTAFSTALTMSDYPNVQEYALLQLASQVSINSQTILVVKLLDGHHIKSSILTRLSSFLSASPPVLVSPSLTCMHALFPQLDRPTVLSTVLPAMKSAIKCLDSQNHKLNTVVIPKLTSMFHDLASSKDLNIPPHVIATEILTATLELAFSRGVNTVLAFKNIMNESRAILNSIESVHEDALKSAQSLAMKTAQVLDSTTGGTFNNKNPGMPDYSSNAVSALSNLSLTQLSNHAPMSSTLPLHNAQTGREGLARPAFGISSTTGNSSINTLQHSFSTANNNAWPATTVFAVSPSIQTPSSQSGNLTSIVQNANPFLNPILTPSNPTTQGINSTPHSNGINPLTNNPRTATDHANILKMFDPL